MSAASARPGARLWGERLALALLAALAALLLIVRPTQVPALWFDEGWNLDVAANLASRGSYAQLAMGQLVAPDLVSTGWPGIVPLAASFRLFGIGDWQGRLPGIVFTAAVLGLLYLLGRRLYNSLVGAGTLFVALLMTGAHIHLHPVILGRQAIGEIPALFYLLLGYLILLWGWERRPWLAVASALCWGVALATKSQMIPFLAASLLVAAGMAGFRRRWRWTLLLAGALVLSLAVFLLANAAQPYLFPGPSLPESRLGALFQGMAAGRSNTNLDMVFVTALAPHLAALTAAWTVLLPAVAGLGWAAWRLASGRDESADASPARSSAEVALLALTGSWLLWWGGLSIGWLRYLFPGLLVSSLFTARLLHDLTGGFSLAYVGAQLRTLASPQRWTLRTAGVLAAVALVLIAGFATARTLDQAYRRDADASLPAAIAYLNGETPGDAVVETFESELLFLLQRRAHYPSNEVQFQLNRRAFLGQDIEVSYDPLQADPDLLVVGPMGKLWNLYEPAIADGSFRLVRQEGLYDIYERVRQ